MVFYKNTFILIICLTNLFSRDVFISFQYKSVNNVLKVSNFNCSLAMTKSNKKSTFLFKIPANNEKILLICRKNKEKIINYLLQNEIYITSNEKMNNFSITSRVVATFLVKRFDIIIKEGFAYFYLKGDE